MFQLSTTNAPKLEGGMLFFLLEPAQMQSQSVNPSEGSGDGDAATNSFMVGIIHAVRAEVLAFGMVGAMLMLNDKTDAKVVMKAVYNNPQDMWRTKAMEPPYVARVAHRVLAIPATQAQPERMCSTAGLTANKKRGSLDSENLQLLVVLRCNWTAIDDWHAR